jgi:Formyl transferase
VRIVILASSVYSETACAMAAHLSRVGYRPVGVLSLSALNRRTLIRKFGQLGRKNFARYARAKLIAHRGDYCAQIQNPYLEQFLEHDGQIFRNLKEVGKSCGFPIEFCGEQNSPSAIACLQKWSPDLIVFTGGNILRSAVLSVPRLGVLNVHLGMLPQIRGMSSPEWSLLNGVPLGSTIHYMNGGIDTGPILHRYEYPDVAGCESLPDLRQRLIAFGVEKIAEVIARIDRGSIVPLPQRYTEGERAHDTQHFVMHEWLQARAAKCLAMCAVERDAGTIHG